MVISWEFAQGPWHSGLFSFYQDLCTVGGSKKTTKEKEKENEIEQSEKKLKNI
jgi:hypothetical protein